MFFCKQKTAYEMRISDWSSDVGSSDLVDRLIAPPCPHDERIIDRHAPDFVHALGFQLIVQRQVPRQMPARASGSEGSRHGKESYRLTLGQVGHLKIIGPHATAFGCRLYIFGQVSIGQAVSVFATGRALCRE